MKNLFLFLIYLGTVITLYGQSANFSDLTDINLKAAYAVKSDIEPEGWIKILQDNGNPLSGSDATTVWLNPNIIKPAAFVSGTTGFFGADFIVNCEVEQLFVRGECSDGKHLPVQELEINGSFYRYRKKPLSEYDNVGNSYSDAPFEMNKVQFHKEYEIQWYVSTDPDLPHDEWVLVDSSVNPLYVTHSTPIANDNNTNNGFEGDNPLDPLDRPTELLLSTLHTSCKYGDGYSDEVSIVENIYTAFKDLCVKRVNNKADEIGDCLSYWNPPITQQTQCSTVSEFLMQGNAACGEWADFFNDMIKIQGSNASRMTSIEYTNNIMVTPEILEEIVNQVNFVFQGCLVGYGGIDFTSLCVKEFNFSNDKIYTTEYASSAGFNLCNDKIITNADQIGISAQGSNNDNPVSIFWDHAIVFYNNKYFDPSYGTDPRLSKVEYEDKAFSGFGVTFVAEYFDVNGNFSRDRFLFLDEKNTLNDNQTIINP